MSWLLTWCRGSPGRLHSLRYTATHCLQWSSASQSTNTDQFNRISSWLHAPTCSTPLTHWLNAPTHSTRWLHASTHSLDKKATVEKAVETVKENKRKVLSSEPSGPPQIKPSLVKRVKDVALHYYHGFRLLALDLRVAVRLLMKTMRGHSLTRREQKQFRRTVGDIFRVVPFSVFVVIPFMEFLLPVYVWLFPNALPSTFQSTSSKEKRKKSELKVKLTMARFLQSTIEEMAVTGRTKGRSESVQEFAKFFEKITGSGEQASTEEILKFSKLFEDELTLDNLSQPQLKALCKLLLLQPIGSSNFLRFQLRMKLRQLRADDQMIDNEGVSSLTVKELQGASQARGMRALGMPEERLKSQLQQWLELHLHQQIPASLLLLSRALYIPEDVPTALKTTLSSLPESIVEETEVLVADTLGEIVDNKVRLEVLRQQEELIKEEAAEMDREKVEAEAADVTRRATEEIVDHAPSLTTPTPIDEGISAEELRNISAAVSSLKGERALAEEKAELEELKEEREEYVEDVADLAVEAADEVVESKGSVRLGKRVEAMLREIDTTVTQLEGVDETQLNQLQQQRSDVISCSQLEDALAALKEISGDAKVKRIVAVLDTDSDGAIHLSEIAEVIESLALEDTGIQAEHIAQIKELIQKEDIIQSRATK
ncbi:mitochondrial proton/calcium exchanger protein-like [Halichondria panicea]|uniref:mitochondrial proton/calcium exchanger protein-like n=1 Tax=Halichondria panicea TaxID=6063 RepID=UPI00312B6E06